MKHSKYKNGGLLFELLTRQITADALENSKTSPATKLVKEYFNKDSELIKEAQIFTMLQQTKVVNEEKAKHLIETTIKAYQKNINHNKLKKEKYNLIKSIKENLTSEDFFRSKIPNYKLLASIYNVLTENLDDPVSANKSYFTVLEHISSTAVKQENSVLKELKRQNKDLRTLAYTILVEKFNKKYESFSSEQKTVLREYINSISNTNGLKEFLDLQFKHVLYELKKAYKKIDNKIIKIKIAECVKLLNETKVTTPKTSQVLKLMRFYQLVSEIRKCNAK
mgnify:FL=1|tara:strand:+ start:362 stop:1201 length:840 start_codon:yes stop_codon:yes gene_type:complete